ncbi:MAG: nuclear transport factor 2 family protein [Terriglobia bacterium]|nr:nuclear transport factor 2 family protein [Terriglobia bacterium]
MIRRVSLFLTLAVAICLAFTVVAQQHEHEAKAEAGFDKTIMQQVWDAWGTLDPANPAKFYSHEPNHTFYDVAPLQYHSWAEYENGVKPLLAGWKSMKPTVNYDGMIHSESPTMTWTTSTVDMDVVTEDGKDQHMKVRWTAIWHKHGNQWLIAHEHVSAPMQ